MGRQGFVKAALAGNSSTADHRARMRATAGGLTIVQQTPVLSAGLHMIAQQTQAALHRIVTPLLTLRVIW